MARGPRGGSRQDPDPLAPLLRWAADDRAERARQGRRRQASLLRQAGEAASWQAVLVEVAERAQPVAMATAIGQLRGTVAAVGHDFCALRDRDRVTLLAFGAVGQVWADTELPVGFRGVRVGWSLADALVELAVDRPVVRVYSRHGPVRTGQLLRAGADVVTLRTDRGAEGSVTCNLGVVDAVALR